MIVLCECGASGVYYWLEIGLAPVPVAWLLPVIGHFVTARRGPPKQPRSTEASSQPPKMAGAFPPQPHCHALEAPVFVQPAWPACSQPASLQPPPKYADHMVFSHAQV